MSLNYLPCAGRLNIDVIKAKQLLQTDLVGGSGEYVSLFKTIYTDMEEVQLKPWEIQRY